MKFKKVHLKIVGIVLLLVTAIGLFASQSPKLLADEDGLVVATPIYSFGGYTSQGKIREADNVISSNLFECEDLRITVDDKFTSNYQVYLFNEDKEFLAYDNLGERDFLLSDYAGQSWYADVYYAAVVIFKNENDSKLTFFDLYRYSKPLEIRVKA